MAPTIAMHAKFSAHEQLALGDWQDKNIPKSSEPSQHVAAMPTRYAGNKNELSRSVKTRCFKMLCHMKSDHVKSWDDVSPIQWDLSDTISKANMGVMDKTVIWKNKVMYDAERPSMVQQYETITHASEEDLGRGENSSMTMTTTTAMIAPSKRGQGHVLPFL